MDEKRLEAWRVRSSKTLLKDRWLHLDAEDCVTANGVEINPYYIIHYPDFVHAAAVTPEGSVVLVRQYRHGARHVSLELPGGLVDAGETPVEAAKRELKEETGYAGDDAVLVHSGWGDPVRFRNRLHLVLITHARPVAEATPEETEGLALKILPWPELGERVRTGEISHPTQLSSLLHLNLLAGDLSSL